MIATIPSATLFGVEGRPVSVEVHVSNGLPGFTVVGLPDAACRESRDRVRAALLSSGLPWPLRRVTVNLAPSGVRKGGAGLDLPIAIGPPGSGKTMLARRLAPVLPPLGRAQALETTRVHSTAGLALSGDLVRRSPFRAPHHGASDVSLIGGGTSWMRPGEISLAHNG